MVAIAESEVYCTTVANMFTHFSQTNAGLRLRRLITYYVVNTAIAAITCRYDCFGLFTSCKSVKFNLCNVNMRWQCKHGKIHKKVRLIMQLNLFHELAQQHNYLKKFI